VIHTVHEERLLLSVAVIEDDVLTLELVTETLEQRLSATVYPFSRSKLARDFLLQQTPESLHLIISDQVMPHFDGLSLLQTCRAANLHIPFLLITADPSKALVMEARKLGASGFLAKPIDMAELTEKVLATAARHP
jgi:two-component system chemotaxis response regulator CheY